MNRFLIVIDQKVLIQVEWAYDENENGRINEGESKWWQKYAHAKCHQLLV